MTVFEIFKYTNPHKGWGRGNAVDYFVTDDPKLESFSESDIDELPREADVVKAAGYKVYQHGAREVSADWLEERVEEIDENVLKLKRLRQSARGVYRALKSGEKPHETPGFEEKFNQHLERWLEETAHLSNPTDKFTNPHYQRIIGMGEEALPLIFENMREEDNVSGHWHWALCSITCEDPTDGGNDGDIIQVAEDWLEWAEERGI